MRRVLTVEPNRGVGGRGGEVVADQSLGLSAVRVCCPLASASVTLVASAWDLMPVWARAIT